MTLTRGGASKLSQARPERVKLAFSACAGTLVARSARAITTSSLANLAMHSLHF